MKIKILGIIDSVRERDKTYTWEICCWICRPSPDIYATKLASLKWIRF